VLAAGSAVIVLPPYALFFGAEGAAKP